MSGGSPVTIAEKPGGEYAWGLSSDAHGTIIFATNAQGLSKDQVILRRRVEARKG